MRRRRLATAARPISNAARSPAWPGEAAALAAALRREVSGEVRFDRGTRALYATDASNYRQVPIGVVCPRDGADVEATVALCHRFRAPVLARGAGTSLAGQACNVAVVLDFSRHLNRVLEVDPERGLARVEPGVVLDRLQEAAAVHGLRFGPDPATHGLCTLGGMIGNNSCGVHSVEAGKTSDNVASLDVLTYDGQRLAVGPTSPEELAGLRRSGGRRAEIYRRLAAIAAVYADRIRAGYPAIPRRVSGYNLDELLPERGFHVGRALVGSEGTCAVLLQAVLQLRPLAAHRVLLLAGFADLAAAADRVPEVLAARPSGLEAIDGALVSSERVRRLDPDLHGRLAGCGGWLLVEFPGGSVREATARAEALRERLAAAAAGPAELLLLADPELQRRAWELREAALGAGARDPRIGDTWPGWEDAAVAPERLGSYLRDFERLLEGHRLRAALFGHFGDGCLHSQVTFELATRRGAARYRRFLEEAADLVAAHGGSLSGEHGDGQARGELLGRMFGGDLVQAFREFKAVWDPDHRLNPGKVVDARPLDADLRLAALGDRPPPATELGYPEDDGSFSRAVLRCVGVGQCRRLTGGTMCPSYRVTGEERHSTRGRARLLFEMLQGEVLSKGWRSREVKEALDLCLACKACKRDCPAGVDMAAYKAEFLSHYWRRRVRPPAAYTLGLVHDWARLASRTPAAANRLIRSPGLAGLVKRLGGVDAHRSLPPFAPRTFRQWFRARPARGARSRRVLLFPDTFTNHFQPAIAQAAVEVLEAAGVGVEIPSRDLCCGRPLYDFGFLGRARRRLRQILEALDEGGEGDPVLVLEPSCAAVFRDELPNLLAGDDAAARLAARTVTLAELLDREGIQPPAVSGQALLHPHCHQRAVLGTEADGRILARAGMTARILDAGCCGMAGAFGFEKGKVELSLAVGELALFPALREAGQETVVLADGFSCRQQIVQATGARPLHLAELLRRGLGETSPP